MLACCVCVCACAPVCQNQWRLHRKTGEPLFLTRLFPEVCDGGQNFQAFYCVVIASMLAVLWVCTGASFLAMLV